MSMSHAFSMAIALFAVVGTAAAESQQQGLAVGQEDAQLKRIFSHGVAAFNGGDFTLALKFFEAAQNGGYSDPMLYFNLGSTYYMMGRLPEARSAYLKLIRDPEKRHLALYNLGLTAYKAGDYDEAEEWFQHVSLEAPDSQISVLADEMLRRIKAPPVVKPSDNRPWRGFLGAALAYDDNVELVNDDIPISNQVSDLYNELLANLRIGLRGTSGEGETVSVTAVNQSYSDRSEFDFRQISVSGIAARRFARWQTRGGGKLSVNYLGGAVFQKIAKLELRVQRPLAGRDYLQMGLEMGQVSVSSPQYRHLDGQRYRFRVQRALRGSGHRLHFTYALEINDREDFRRGVEFASSSPLRHSLRADLAGRFGRRWGAVVDLRYRASRYPDENVFLDDAGERVSRARVDHQFRVRPSVTFQLSKRWQVEGSYEFTESDSNIDEYSYSRSVTSVGVNVLF